MDRADRTVPGRTGAVPSVRRTLARIVPALLAVTLLGACDSNDDGGAAAPLAREDVRDTAALRPYRETSPWAPVLQGCATVGDPLAACTLEVLPFIAQTTDAASIDDVLERTLVTHDWMGERFEALLRAAPPDLVRMFGAVTSISIGSTVRPSNYWIGTGAVQLDPADLWLTLDEKRNVATGADFRAPFARVLAFRNEWAQRADGRPIGPTIGLEDRRTRSFEDIVLPFASVMYHELAHANDFLPPGEAAGLDPAARPSTALLAIADRWLSTRLVTASPLESLILQRLARVRFLGETPTASEAAIGPAVAGAAMDGDGALLFYGYRDIHEDFALLVEAALMKVRHDVDFHLAFTDVPMDPDAVRCADLTVGWGVRNRLGDPVVNTRAGLAAASVFPDDLDLQDAVRAAQGTQESMAPGTNWCENVGGVDDRTPGGEPGEPDPMPASITPRGRDRSNGRDGHGTAAGPLGLVADDAGTDPGATPPAEPVSHATRHAIIDARRRDGVR